MTLLTTCVQCESKADLARLNRMIRMEVQVTYRTARRRIGPELLEWARSMGYDRWLPLSKDWHVSFHKSWWGRRRCYYVRWSAIEHVFV